MRLREYLLYGHCQQYTGDKARRLSFTISELSLTAQNPTFAPRKMGMAKEGVSRRLPLLTPFASKVAMVVKPLGTYR